MNISTLERHFVKIGKGLKIEVLPERNWRMRSTDFTLDVAGSGKNEVFHLSLNEGAKDLPEIQILDVRPDEKALLLMVRDEHKSKFLCGMDEFNKGYVAAIPLNRGATNVKTAKEALKPEAVIESQSKAGVKEKHKNKRKTKGWIRQGEWFFVPAPDFEVRSNDIICNNEPFNRTGSRNHTAQQMVRRGGELVYQFGIQVISATEYNRRIKDPKFHPQMWRQSTENATFYVKGRITAPDHSTLVLNDWHTVHSNQEHLAPTRNHVRFLD